MAADRHTDRDACDQYDTMKTLGVTLDQNLILNKHVSLLSRNIHFYTRALRHIRPALTDSMAAGLGTSLVQSRLDYARAYYVGGMEADCRQFKPRGEISTFQVGELMV